MPIVQDSSGHFKYVSAHPRTFLHVKEFERRIERAQAKVLDAIRFAQRPLTGLGTCHEFAIDTKSSKSAVVQLADYVNFHDDRRATKVRAQRHRELTVGLAPHEHRMRSPRQLFRRRSSLFSGKEIPVAYFGKHLSQTETHEIVQHLRWILIKEAVEELHADGVLELVGNIWTVKVSRMDTHRLRSHRHTNRVKYDDRSYHGHPNNARKRPVTAMAS